MGKYSKQLAAAGKAAFQTMMIIEARKSSEELRASTTELLDSMGVSYGFTTREKIDYVEDLRDCLTDSLNEVIDDIKEDE